MQILSGIPSNFSFIVLEIIYLMFKLPETVFVVFLAVGSST